MFKFGIIFSVILLAFSVQINSNHLKPNDSITDLLDKLKNVVNQSISDTTDALTQVVYKLEVTASNAQREAATAMQNIVDDFKAETSTFIAVASDNGVDADECLGNYEEVLNQTISIVFNGLISNAASLVQDGANRAATVLNDVQKARDEVTEIEKEIEDCENNDDTEDCLNDLSTRIQNDIVSIPNTAAHEVVAARVSMDSSCLKIGDTAVYVLNQCVMQTSQLTIAVLECINDKLSGK